MLILICLNSTICSKCGMDIRSLRFCQRADGDLVYPRTRSHIYIYISVRKNNGGVVRGAAADGAPLSVRIAPYNLISHPYSRPFNELVLISDSWNY